VRLEPLRITVEFDNRTRGLKNSSQQKDYERALGYLAHARDVRPNDAAIEFFFGIGCVEMDLVVEARKALRRAVELAPELAPEHLLRGLEIRP
jgi:Flp pilus assembly protein TadD